MAQATQLAPSYAELWIIEVVMQVMDYIIQLERRIKALEANRGGSLRYCEVTDVSPDGHARVKLLDGDEMVSLPLRILQRRTLKDKDQCFPDVGEHVACLFAGQGLESGVVLGAMYSDKNKSAGQESHMSFYEFEDGTKLAYDRQEHKLKADVQGDAEVKTTKSATVEAEEGATIKAKQELILEGQGGVVMRGPSIKFQGVEDGRCKTIIDADINFRGDLHQDGSQFVTKDITAEGKITGNPVRGCI